MEVFVRRALGKLLKDSNKRDVELRHEIEQTLGMNAPLWCIYCTYPLIAELDASKSTAYDLEAVACRC